MFSVLIGSGELCFSSLVLFDIKIHMYFMSDAPVGMSWQVESHKLSANLLRDLVKELCITDCYRYVNPTTRLYTRHNIRSFARLDRIYVSTFLKSHIQCIPNTPCPISDHDSVNAVFCLPSASRKKSYWKLNVSILEDVEYIHLVPQFWEFWSEKTQVF